MPRATRTVESATRTSSWVSRVAFMDPNIVLWALGQLGQQFRHAHFIGFGTDQTNVRILARELKQVLASPKTDFQPQSLNSVRKLRKSRFIKVKTEFT